jgi:hypothetical protein
MEASLEEWNASYLHDTRRRDAAAHLNSSELRECEGDQSRLLTVHSALVILKENEALKKRLAEADKTCQSYVLLATLRVQERDVVNERNVALEEENLMLKKKMQAVEAERDDLRQQIPRHVNPFKK